MMTAMNPTQRAISHIGSQALLAKTLGITQPCVSEWARGERPVPIDRCGAIERATEGFVTCDELRPDLEWSRIADKAWPWHPKGRPVLDVTKAEAA